MFSFFLLLLLCSEQAPELPVGQLDRLGAHVVHLDVRVLLELLALCLALLDLLAVSRDLLELLAL